MAYLAVDEFGIERIFQNEPERCDLGWEDPKNKLYDSRFNEAHENTGVMLPGGTIKKLTGKKLTWKDNPLFFNKL